MGKLNRAGKKRRRQNNVRDIAPPYCLIITEGTETEVNYFENIKDNINKKYKDKISVQPIGLKVKGIGKGTSSLVKEAIKRRSLGTYSEVWVVFDKDDFLDFDDAIKLAKKEGLNVAWSNESFELWLLLHFQDLNSSFSRDTYKVKLDNHFKRLGYNNGKYEKNIKNIFELMKEKTSKAIERSDQLLNEYKYSRINTPSKMNPATTIQSLVKNLWLYVE